MPAVVGGEDCAVKLTFAWTMYLPEKPWPPGHAEGPLTRCFGCGKNTSVLDLGRLRCVDRQLRFERGDYCPRCEPYERVEVVFSLGRETDRVLLVGWIDEQGRPYSEFDEQIGRWQPLDDSRGLRWTHKDLRPHTDRFDGLTREVVSLSTPKTPRA